jgi:hypothetical protein
MVFQLPFARQRAPQESHDLVNGLGRVFPVAGCASQTSQEAYMPRNAIPHFAKAGEINEKPLLEKRRERII